MKLFYKNLLLVFIFFLVELSCGVKEVESQLIGRWIITKSEIKSEWMSVGTEFVFVENQILSIPKYNSGNKCYYTVSGDTISYSIGAEIVMATYEFKENLLTLKMLNSNNLLVFERK